MHAYRGNIKHSFWVNKLIGGLAVENNLVKLKTPHLNTKLKKQAPDISRYWQLYLMLLLPIVFTFIFSYYPMYGVQIAFKKYTAGLGITGSPWVGFYYFEKFLTSYKFVRILMNTITISFYHLIAGFPIPIILAFALNTTRSNLYRKTVQMLTYMPHFISTVVMVGILVQTIEPRSGLASNLFRLFGMSIPNLIGSPEAFPHLYVWSGIWQSAGWGTIIYLATLASVDPELHEAALVDGASRFQRLIHIDWPTLIPTTVILLILNTGNIMSLGFEKAFLMQNDLNIRASEIISTYTYKIGLISGGGDFSYATAIGLFNSIINITILVSVNAVSKRITSNSLW